VHGLIAEAGGGAWTLGGAILSFALPMILVVVVAIGLYVVYTKPEVVPGHPAPAAERPVSYTRFPGLPTADRTEQSRVQATGGGVPSGGQPPGFGGSAEPEDAE
jgi:hypothetical protein